MKPANAVLSSYGTTVFEVMNQIAAEHGAINLGQGFPVGMESKDVLEAAASAVVDGWNQYPPMMGLPALRQAVAEHESRFYGLDVDWQSEVMVTSGATEALADCFLGLINPGDEVVLIEPLYDSYLPMIRRAGGVPKLVRVEPPDWSLPREALESAFSEKTKLLLLNNPLNPAAKVFDPDELAFLAGLVERFDAYAVCDEVYEHITFDGRRHTPLITMPGMRNRCIKIGSAGKTFSLTGWKVGYITAAADLLQPIAKAHQFVTFTTPPNLQSAVAYGLALDDAYFERLAVDMQDKRDRCAAGLEAAGFAVIDCAGTYFISADFRPLGFDGDDIAFCRYVTEKAGVTALPVSAFYQQGDVTNYVRFCFCKEDEVLDKANRRLKSFFKG
jgi:N-succinyldiaminopimelate aminotransferase